MKHDVTPVAKEVCAIKTSCAGGPGAPGGGGVEEPLAPGASSNGTEGINGTVGAGEGSTPPSGESTSTTSPDLISNPSAGGGANDSSSSPSPSAVGVGSPSPPSSGAASIGEP